MSDPYIYNPNAYYSPHFYQTSYYPSTPRSITPVIPDAALYPSSPYGSPNRSGLPLPDPTTPNQPDFLTLSPYDAVSSPNAPWDGFHRERRPSWQGFYPGAQWSPAAPAATLYSTDVGRRRRHSFGATAYPYPYSEIPTSFKPFAIHPWINPEFPRPDFYFDLALPVFQPLQLFENGESRSIAEEYFDQPATQPPALRLKIVFDDIPEWPCEIQVDTPPMFALRPITLLQVLRHLHRHMHTQVTPEEWAMLSTRGKTDIASVFTKRCRNMPDNLHDERAKGLMRVDYLKGRTRMLGLLHVGRENGYDVLKLIVI